MKFTGTAFALLALLASAAAEAQQPNVAVWGENAASLVPPAPTPFTQVMTINSRSPCSLCLFSSSFIAMTAGGDVYVLGWPDSNRIDFLAAGATMIRSAGTSGPPYYGMLTSTGSVRLWTNSEVTGQAGPFVHFDLGQTTEWLIHGVGVSSAGVVTCWGTNGNAQYGFSNVPAGLPAATRVAKSATATAALLSTGTVRVWGGAGSAVFQPPAGLAGVTDVQGGGDAFIALLGNGSVATWGKTTAFGTDLTPPVGLSQVVQVDTDGVVAVARRGDGSVVYWGSGSALRQAAIPANQQFAWVGAGCSATSATGTDIVVIDAAGGAINPGSPVVPALLRQTSDTLRDVVVSTGQVEATRASGFPAVWPPRTTWLMQQPNYPLAYLGRSANGVQAIATLSNGQAFELGNTEPMSIPGTSFKAVEPFTSRIDSSGNFRGWLGLTQAGSLQTGGPSPHLTTGLPAGTFVQIEVMTNDELCCWPNTLGVARDAGGFLSVWGPQDYCAAAVPADVGSCSDFACGADWIVAVRANGSLRAWGGQSITAAGAQYGVLTVPAGTFTDVAAGYHHGLALRADGTVAGWGRNHFGQKVAPNGTFTRIAAGQHTSAAVIASSDCNGNGLSDASEIAANPQLDCNLNGRLDSCDDVDTAGQPRRWTNAAGGSFQTCSNWAPVAPGNNAAVEFALPSTYSVSFSQNRTTRSAAVTSGSVTMSMGSRTYTLSGLPATDSFLRVGSSGNAALGIIGGTVSAPYARVGEFTGETGTLNIGSGGRLIATTDLCVGCAGTGTMNITSGGRVTTSEATIGASIGGSGTVSLSGSLSKWIGNLGIDVRRGTLSIASPASVDVPNVPLVVFQGGTVRGTGTVNGDVANFGDGSDGTCGLEPGAGTAGALVGNLTIAGNYGQIPADPKLGNNSGSLGIDVVGGGSGVSADLVDIQGQASLGGGLFVRIPQGDPGNFANVPILTAGLLDPARPAFDVAYLPALPDGRFIRVNTVGALAGAVISLSTDTLAGILGFGGANSAFVAGQPLAGASGDFDGDGDTDIAVTVAGSTPTSNGALLVLFNDGTGALSGVLQIPLGVDPVAIAAGRLRDNGPIDLVVANRGSDNIQMLFNNGNGVFATGAIVSTGAGSQPNSIALAPIFATFVGQSLDIGVTLGGLNSIRVFRNNNGTPIPAQTAPTGPRPGSVGGDDVDNDRDIDFVVANTGNGTATVFKNTTGTFADAGTVNLGVGVRSLAMADLNNDGYADFVTVNEGDATVASSVSVVMNRSATTPGTVQFAPAVNVPAGSLPASPAVGDFDADGDLDVAYAGTRTPAAGGQRVVMVLRNDGTSGGVLQISPGEDVATTQSPNIVLAAQMNSDPVTDIVALGQTAAFSSAVPAYTANVLPSSAGAGNCPADLTGDGLVDGADLGTLLSAWGPGTTGDLTGDGLIDGADLGTLLSVWGPCGSQ